MNLISIVYNGRFATRPASGVDLVAAEVFGNLRSLAQRERENHHTLCLIVPRRPQPHNEGALPSILESAIPVKRAIPTGALWEQVELPLLQPSSWLFSPCNVGPITGRRQVVLIHDAQTSRPRCLLQRIPFE